MKNPLLKHIFRRISDSGLKTLTTAFLMLVLFVGSMKAQVPPVNKTECSCLNNATNGTNGQYLDAFSINSGISGQNWVLVNPIIGFYHPASLPPPAAPILYLPNTSIPETSPGVYTISGKRVSGQSWSVKIRNLSNSQELEVHSIQSCSYPNNATNTAIVGDASVCKNSSEAYVLNAGLYSGLAWTVSGGFLSFNTPNPFTTLNVNWGPTAGRYSIGVSGVANSYAAQPLGCNFTSSRVVDVVETSPYTSITGDFGNCLGATETYKIAATVSQLQPGSVVWGVYLDAAATIPAPGISLAIGSINSKTITWPSTAGVYYLAVRGSFRINSSSDYCTFVDIKRVDIVNEPVRPLACNNLVQLSMNPSCELYFTPDQFLEAQNYPNSSYDIIIRDIQKDTLIPNGTLGFNYIGKTLEIKIVHECSGNSCWGYAKIEDKSIPDLVCPNNIIISCEDLNDLSETGMPVFPVGVVVTPVSGTVNKWTLSGYDKCSSVTLTYTDAVTDNNCSGLYSSTIGRTWSVTDGTGNTSTCLQIISVLRASIVDVVFPFNWDSATGPNGNLEACGNWPKIAYTINGIEQTYIDGGVKVDSVPDPAYTGYPFGIACLKAAVTYSDKKILLCGTNPHVYKLVRKWKVIDHCATVPNNIREMNQLITVMDTYKPEIDVVQAFKSNTCFYGLGEAPGIVAGTPKASVAILNTKEHQCYGESWTVLPPYLLRDCSKMKWNVKFKLGTDCNDPGEDVEFKTVDGVTAVLGTPGTSNYRIDNLPIGRSWIRYYVEDECGNANFVTVEIDVVDNQPPTPVCDRNSIIAIGANAEAYAGVLTFDDGSHDNCELTCMKIRRMDNPVAWSSLPCDNELKFTCGDIGKIIMVELYVEDKGKRFNTCMVEAKVQDNIFPKVTPPANTTANCYEDLTSLTRFGSATVTDNCTATVKDSVVRNINDCGVGTITRYFIATDAGKNKSTASQVITVGNNHAFTNANIDWPDTYTTNVSCISDLSPDKLGADYARPRFIGNTECSQVAASYEDIVFNFADNVCVKIIRQWKVIDWCQRNAFIPGSGEWTYPQLIMINNVDGPDFLTGCANSDLTIEQVGTCSAKVNVTATAKDDCTPSDKLVWSYTVDEGNNGSVEVTNGVGAAVSRVFPYGTHKITWTVKDGCKNEKSCSNVFTIADDKKPTPYCITELGTVIMPVAKEVTIWASDFDRGASDNCSTSAQLTASFSATNRNDISRTIRCADLGGLPSKEFTFDVYVIDASGNSDFCTVRLVVQDNGNTCNPTANSRMVSLRGNIYTESDEMVQDVNIELRSNQTEFPKAIKTDDNGKFSFAELPMYKDYSLAAEKNDDALNGVSTLDLVMIQRHILGLSELESPYKLIAADVNNSAKITASDLVELRKLILGIQTEFTNNKSWRFIDVAHKFTDVTNPFPYTEYAEMVNLDHDVAGLDFVAVKIGDVNGSATSNIHSGGVHSRSITKIIAPSVSANAGDVITLDVNAEELMSLVGMQMTLAIDQDVAELIEINSDVLSLKSENLGFSRWSEGIVNVSWNHSSLVQAKNKLFTVTVKLHKTVKDHSLITLVKSGLNPEAYLNDGSEITVTNLQLETANRIKSETERFEVFQNVPNPFNATTVIGFNLPVSNTATLKLYDLTGKLIYQNSANFPKGYNTFNIDAQALNLTGVLYYQIDTDTDSATRKMIIIK